MNLEQQVKTK